MDGAAKNAARPTSAYRSCLAVLADGYFASFLAPEEFARNMAPILRHAAECGRVNARIESGLILLCRLRASRERGPRAGGQNTRPHGRTVLDANRVRLARRHHRAAQRVHRGRARQGRAMIGG